MLISYSQDMVKQIIADIEKQGEQLMAKKSKGTTIENGPRVFVIQDKFALMTSLLLNDIQTFANRYSLLRLQNEEYFDLTEQEVGMKEHKPINSTPIDENSNVSSAKLIRE